MNPAARILAGVGVGVTILALAGGVTVSRLEENDRFCASCHMAPERTYYNRAQFARAGVEPLADLASAHAIVDPTQLPHGVSFRCIDCHRGDEGPVHRAATMALGARDALIYVLGRADQTVEKAEVAYPALLTASCLNCHTDTLLEVGFPNHFHNRLPAAYRAWQAGGQLRRPVSQPELYDRDIAVGLEPVAVDLLCVDCHLAHVETPGAELQGFLDLERVVYPACEECHQEALGEPLGLTAQPDG